MSSTSVLLMKKVTRPSTSTSSAAVPSIASPSSVINAFLLSFANCVRPPDKSMQANGLNRDASKSYLEKLNRILEMMFKEIDMWIVANLVFNCSANGGTFCARS